MYGPKGQGNLARRLAELEIARTNALENDAGRIAGLRGQDINAATSRDNASLQARTNALSTMAGLVAGEQQTRAAGLKAAADAQSATAKLQAEAQENLTKKQQQGYENFMSSLQSRFVTTGPDGKQTVDTAEQENFLNFVAATDPKRLKEEAGISSLQDLFSMDPQEQLKTTQQLMTMYGMQGKRNEMVQRGWLNSGPTLTGYDAPDGAPREVEIGDVTSGNYPFSSYLYDQLPFTDDMVQQLASGAVVPYDEYVGNNGDAELARKATLRNKP
jgi:hypothetical protein